MPKRKSTRSKYGSSRRLKFKRKRLARFVRRVAKGIPETKWIIQSVNDSISHNGAVNVVYYPLVSNCSQGVTQQSRIGNKISLTSVQLDLVWTMAFNSVNVSETVGLLGSCINQVWVVTNATGASVEQALDYINAWGVNIVNYSMPDTNIIKVLKMRRYPVGLTVTPTAASLSNNGGQVFLTFGTGAGNFKYSRRKNKMMMHFESSTDTLPDNRNYWLILVTQGPAQLNGETTYAGRYKYTFKDA